MNKLNLIYDASTLYDGAYATSARSGIYFCGINILKTLVNRSDIDIILFCSEEKIPEVKKVLTKEFPDYKYKLISNITLNPFTDFFQNLKFQRRKVKAEEKNKIKRAFLKAILQFSILFLTPFNSIIKFLYNLTSYKNDYSSYAFLSPSFPINKKFAKCKKYTILHDTIPLIMPEKNPMALKSWYAILLSSLNGQDYYFANSKNTRRDFIKYFPQIDPDKIITVLHACGTQFKPPGKDKIEEVKQRYNILQDKKYIFSLCTLEPRKNLIRTVKTFIKFIQKNNIDDLVFVLGGGHWQIFIEQLEQTIKDLGNYQDKILKIGYVGDEDLPTLYSGAEWFVYTSQYEGFGVPPLEAMSCGCPVITSNNSSLPEVVGDAGLMIDWNSDEQHINAYEKYYFNNEIRKEYANRGLERAKLFSWEKSTDKMLDFIRSTACKQ